MRMRKMKNLEPRMERCAALRIQAPEEKKGHWRELKPECTQLWVEVGCGKGKFTAETAQANPDVLLIAVERCREAMVVAMEKARDMGLTNVYYIDMDVAEIENIFAPGEIDRLFINFPDPWPRKKNAKRRLTHRASWTNTAGWSGRAANSILRPTTPPCSPSPWRSSPPAAWKPRTSPTTCTRTAPWAL